MRIKAVSGTILTLLVMSTLMLALGMQPVDPQGVSAPVTLLTNLEYPTSLWVKEDKVYLTETAGRNTVWGGKVCLDQYDVVTGEKSVLINNPLCSDAVVVASDGKIYLTSYLDCAPGEQGMVSVVDPLTNVETHLLDIEIASEDMFIDSNDDIFVIGLSDQPGAKSIYLLPSGDYTNPTVLKTGLGRAACISKSGSYIYYAHYFEPIKRFSYPSGPIETFVNKPKVLSVSLSSEYLYYADYFGGTVGRINIQTKADETVVSSLNGPICVRFDQASNRLYFLEAGTDAVQFKDGTLKFVADIEDDEPPVVDAHAPPGTYVEAFWERDNSYNFDVDIQITDAPDNAIVLFWAHQFGFVGGNGGYIGLQTVGSQKKAIFSIWDAIRGEPGNPFTGEGEGWQILIDYDWKLDNKYRLRIWELGVEENGDEWWQGAVYDYATSTETIVGKILVPASWEWLSSWSVTWIEYAGYQSCDVPYTRAVFSGHYARHAEVDGPPEKLRVSYGTSPCTKSDVDYYEGTTYALEAGDDVIRDTPEGFITMSRGPEIISVTFDKKEVDYGYWVTITVEARNNGDKADEMYISVSLPDNPPIDNIQIVSHDLQDAHILSVGEEVWGDYGTTYPVVLGCPLVEGFKENWETGETKTLQFKVRPHNLGTFRFFVKTTAQANGEWSFDPQFGTKDQQNEYVAVYEVFVDRRFSPIVDGFQFSNNEFTTKIKMSIEEIRDYFESSQLATAIPRQYWTIFIYLIQAVAWAQQGYCGGMVLTAEQYFENPWLLPSGYSQAHDIPLTDTTTTALISSNQWITQLIADDYLLKWLLLRLGDDPSGLVPLNDEIEWILQQLDQKNVVKLTVFDPSFDWWASHAVLAYDYATIGNNIYLKIYGPNLGNVVNGQWYYKGNWYNTDSEGGQTIHLVKDGEGNYEVADGVTYIEGFEITRLGSREAPIWGWTWVNLLNYIHEILQHVIEYLIREGTTLLTIRAESPVDLLVTAPNGLRVGYDSVAQTVVNQVEGAMYSGPGTEPQIIVISDPIQGVCIVDVFGTGTGDYTIKTESAANGTIIGTFTVNGTASDGKLEVHLIELKEDYSVVPEFHPFLILPLFMIATLLAVIVYKRKHPMQH